MVSSSNPNTKSRVVCLRWQNMKCIHLRQLFNIYGLSSKSIAQTIPDWNQYNLFIWYNQNIRKAVRDEISHKNSSECCPTCFAPSHLTYTMILEKRLSLMVKLFFSNVILNLAEFLHPKALQSDHIAWNLKHMGAAVSKNKPLDCA